MEVVRAVKDAFDIEVIAGNISTGCGGRGAHRRWSRCVEGRPGSRLDLYDEGRRRRRRAAGDGDLRLRAGGRGRRGTGHRRWRHHLVGRRRQGDRHRRRRDHGRVDARGNRRGARRDPRSCRASGSRSTGRWARSARCAPARSRRIATSRAMSRTPRSSSPRESKRASRTRGRWRRSSTSSSAACVRRWATAVRQRSRRCNQAQFVRMTGAGLRESHPHDVTITKDAPNYRRG